MLMVFGAMLLMPFALLASDGSNDAGPISSIFVTFVTLVAAIPLVVEAVKKVIKTDIKIINQIISWITGIALTMAGWWLGFGFLVGLVWWHALIVGLCASLAANGVYDTSIYEYILRAVGILKPLSK